MTTVALSATDAHGNTSNASFNVIVGDHTPPVIATPANIIAEATALRRRRHVRGHRVRCRHGDVPVTASPLGTAFALGLTTTVSLSASDGSGNTSHTSFTVKVVDTTPPAFSVVPSDVTAEPSSATGAVVTYTVPVAADLDGPVTIVTDHANGTLFPFGTTVVQYTATDASGNVSSGSFKVTVADTLAPMVAAPDNVVREATGPSGAVLAHCECDRPRRRPGRRGRESAQRLDLPFGNTHVNLSAPTLPAT